MNYLGNIVSGYPVIVSPFVTTEWKYREFKWKLKWYQRIFHKFRKHVVLVGKYAKPAMIFCIDKFIVNDTCKRKLKNTLRGCDETIKV
jgi:hypothetical protein